MPNKVNTQIGDRNINIQIEGFKEDLGIINEIYKKVLKESKKNISFKKDKKFLEVNKKIELNITNEQERKRIKELFESIYNKISLIEKTFSNLDSSDQREITIDISDRYSEKLIKPNSNAYSALNSLFTDYIPLEKRKDPKYNNLAKAFVLFFFEDCTLGRKE